MHVHSPISTLRAKSRGGGRAENNAQSG